MAITKQSPTPVVPTSRRSTRWLPVIWFTLFSLLGGAFLWHAFSHDPTTTPAKATLASASSQPRSQYVTQAIRDIQVGTWDLADNPETDDDEAESDFGDVVPADWRRIRLRMTKEDGSTLDLERLRPKEWTTECSIGTSGDRVHVDLEELGAFGIADILSIGPYPNVSERPSVRHRLVTGKFTHLASDIIHVALDGLENPIGVTSGHLFWSVDRQQFIAADRLQIGERLLQANGGTTTVSDVGQTLFTETVYNLEVSIEHTYFVSPSGVLVHNACTQGVYVLFDKATKEVKYVGRGNVADRFLKHARTPGKWDPGQLKIADGLSKPEAKRLEQLLIDRYHGAYSTNELTTLLNLIRSYAPTNPNVLIYNNALNSPHGVSILRGVITTLRTNNIFY